jgi:hypothetical protein
MFAEKTARKTRRNFRFILKRKGISNRKNIVDYTDAEEDGFI